MKPDSSAFNPRLALAAGVAVVGIVVAWRGLSHSPPTPPAPSGSSADSTANEDTPSPTASATTWTATRWGTLLPADRMRFEVHPTEQSLPRVVEDAGARVLALASTLEESEAAIDAGRIDQLRQRFERHFQLLLAASYDEWLAHIQELGGSFAGAPGEEGGPPTREQWLLQAEALRLSPLSIDSMSLRPLYLDGEEIGYPDPPVWGQAVYRGAYGAPDDPAEATSDVYEVLVPMQMRVGDGARDKRINVGFSYLWVDDRQTWVPFNVQFYTDEAGSFRMLAF